MVQQKPTTDIQQQHNKDATVEGQHEQFNNKNHIHIHIIMIRCMYTHR